MQRRIQLKHNTQNKGKPNLKKSVPTANDDTEYFPPTKTQAIGSTNPKALRSSTLETMCGDESPETMPHPVTNVEYPQITFDSSSSSPTFAENIVAIKQGSEIETTITPDEDEGQHPVVNIPSNNTSSRESTMSPTSVPSTALSAAETNTDSSSTPQPLMNPLALPFNPPSTYSNESLEKCKKVKVKKKSSLPTTPTSFKHEQMKVELGIIRTKLKQTELQLKESQDTNEILAARNKLFEGKRINDAYEKLFPTTSDAPPTQSSAPSSPNFSNPAISTPISSTNSLESFIQIEVLKTLRSLYLATPNNSDSSEIQHISKKLDNVLSEIESLKTLFLSISAPSTSTPDEECPTPTPSNDIPSPTYSPPTIPTLSPVEPNILQCNQCKFQTKHNHLLMMHMQSIHRGMMFLCDECDYKSPQTSTLKAHKQIAHNRHPKVSVVQHTSQSHTCDQYNNSAMHMKASHEPPKCSLCNFSSTQHYTLQAHKRTVHSERPYLLPTPKLPNLKCDQCNFTSTQQYTLQTHKKTVHAERPTPKLPNFK